MQFDKKKNAIYTNSVNAADTICMPWVGSLLSENFD